MRRKITFILLLISLVLIFNNREKIMIYMTRTILAPKDITLNNKNDYFLEYEFEYVKNVDQVDPRNKKDLLDLYYTIINSGVSQFEFYCPEEYKDCLKDVKEIANNQDDLSNINGFVHPYNSFDVVETSYDSFGKVKLEIIKTYTDVEIKELNNKVIYLITNEVKDEKDKRKIIRIIHDYIINNTKYDKARTDYNIIEFDSSTAWGVFFENYGICSGYSDAMALFLNYYQIPNYKVATENHVWNAVYLDGKWLHLDLTWDDPVSDDNRDILDHTYFLIDNEKLKALNDAQHMYDEKIFIEVAR